MREIKFRAWNKKQNRWANHNELLGDIEVRASVNSPSILTVGEDKYDINTHTGLRDKNGKEIYEGDIARGRYNNWIISFESGCFQGKQSNCVSHLVPICNMASEMIEVIGNIYENPELLGVDE